MSMITETYLSIVFIDKKKSVACAAFIPQAIPLVNIDSTLSASIKKSKNIFHLDSMCLHSQGMHSYISTVCGGHFSGVDCKAIPDVNCDDPQKSAWNYAIKNEMRFTKNTSIWQLRYPDASFSNVWCGPVIHWTLDIRCLFFLQCSWTNVKM